jgi:lipooligosaccharide transport system ATP-binding protein
VSTGPASSAQDAADDSLAIRLRGVHKSFGPLTAVDGLDLDVPRGIVLGLLGPNGAGKSTTMRMLTGQALADSGSIDVLGLTIPSQSKQARTRMGVVPQLDNLDTELTVRQNLTMFAVLYRIPRREREPAVDRALSNASLSDRADSKVNDLSGGMRRRLLIARGLVHDPELVLLDEPTVGLDPQVRQDLWSLIDGLRAQGKTVLMSTHYIEEAERLADDVAVMSKGRVVAQGPPSELLSTHVGEQTIEYYGPPQRVAQIEQLAQDAGLATRRTGPAVSVLGAERAEPDLLRELGDGVARAANLEDVFVLLTGEVLE